MLYYIYDKTFEGLMTCVFEAFSRKELPEQIIEQNHSIPLFSDFFEVISDTEKAERVLNGLKNKISQSALNMLFVSYLSELNNIEIHIFNYVKKALLSSVNIELNFADNDVLFLSKIYKKVQNETTYMKQFVRFQKTADGIYFAMMEPKYNVLPLCSDFFQNRYADQQWIIYDKIRKYGLYYDLETIEIIYFDKPPVFSSFGKLSSEQQDDTEILFQNMWKNYLESITISERKNLRLRRQHMPKRFWKYLTEKN